MVARGRRTFLPSVRRRLVPLKMHGRQPRPNPFAMIPMLFGFTALACLAMRIGTLAVHSHFAHRIFLFPTHLRIDSLFFGVFLSYYWSFVFTEATVQKIRGWRFWFLLAGTTLLSPAFFCSPEKYRWISVGGVMLFYLGSGFLLLFALSISNPNSNLALKFFGALGACSYSVYLWHYPFNEWGPRICPPLLGRQTNYGVYLICYLGGAWFIGFIMARLVELPALKIRDRFFPSRTLAVKP